MRRAWAVAPVLLAGGLGLVLPDWLVFVLALALAKGLVVLGVVLLMSAGLVSFGQGLFFAAGAYAAGFAGKLWGLQDAAAGVALGTAASLLLAAVAGLLLARYREIFFAMLSLALSMILYGVLVKAYWVTGGSDGLTVVAPRLLGVGVAGARLRLGLYLLTVVVTAGAAFVAHRYACSPLGYTARAVKDNEVRVEYLGLSVTRAVYVTYVLAGALAGAGGVLVALNVGHIEPQLAYWTTSGEFVFIALLGGTGNVLAPLVGAVVYEVIRTYAFKYSPYTWQLTLGTIMLLLILFLPGGLWAVVRGGARLGRPWRRSSKPVA